MGAYRAYLREKCKKKAQSLKSDIRQGDKTVTTTDNNLYTTQ